ncbi:L-glutamate gamma-semialdehyde dehydrogenase [Halosquirtibacter laminarini]|uniref:L-glutamate gamma-semialdehyde dehydrogenase n=1 Tax=Halosquirtibacter laminarini TaxID=3374600 RepID=A0AC61NFQ3_9BACT|nr:L-glutamate gamma-semialdehyde dehydrogenase [Prolixibacteraceae bacterium]
MTDGFYRVPKATNEPVYSYEPGSLERKKLQKALYQLRSELVDLPMIIGGKSVYSEERVQIRPPHDLDHLLGYYHQGSKQDVQLAIDAALDAKSCWENMPWHHRASIFLKAADLISGPYRYKINAATMLGQSKNALQAEIDSACELSDFLRFGVQCMSEIYTMQPNSSKGIWNYNEFRPLEGFVFALTPFNFTAIAGNLPAAPAMMGNTVVWKASKTAIYSAHVVMEVFKKAGLPEGVINLVHCSGPDTADVVFNSPDFAGIHFTGSTEVFQSIWKTIGNNITKYRSYPRIVGETGGKDFIFAAPSACPIDVATAIVRGAFEYQGQKCSAASRAYIPRSMWETLQIEIAKQIKDIKVGPVEDFTNFVNAVIDQSSFDKLAFSIDRIKEDEDAEIFCGGTYNDQKGYFVDPTIVVAMKPDYFSMQEELFGPIITLYIYEDDSIDEIASLIDKTSMYALTGAILSNDRYEIDRLVKALRHSAGNFYINDKPTGAVVGQQPFGGGRGSGTNDKAGSVFNLLRWTSIRTIKETFVPATHFMYPNFKPDFE